MFKKLVIRLFLSKELAALKSRLAEATTALTKVEANVIAISKEAPAEVHALGEKILSCVLTSADKVRTAEAPVVHAWAAKLYAAYEEGKDKVGSTLAYAKELIKKTEIFFTSKL